VTEGLGRLAAERWLTLQRKLRGWCVSKRFNLSDGSAGLWCHLLILLAMFKHSEITVNLRSKLGHSVKNSDGIID